MKMKLRVRKHAVTLLEGVYEIDDAGSFCEACADLWRKLEAREFERASSVGALMEQLDQDAATVLDGAVIDLSRM